MAALSADAERKRRNDRGVQISRYIVNSGSTVYKGGLVAFESGGDELIPAADTAGLRIAGVARETATGSGTSVYCEVEYNAEYLFVSAAITGADVGASAVASTDNDLTDAAAATNDVVVGRIVEVPAANTCWVHVMQGVVA